MSNDRGILLKSQLAFEKHENEPTLLKPRGEIRLTFTISSESRCSRLMGSCHSGRSKLTDDIQVVRVIDGAVVILYHAGIISFVGWDHAFHDKAPVLVPYLKRSKWRWLFHDHGTDYQVPCFLDLKRSCMR